MNVPAGYERLLQQHAVAVARADVIPAIRQALVGADGTRGTLYEYATRAPGARAMRGRGTAWAVALPSGPRVVVRHSRHGGLFARITGDRFLAPTRAPAELEIALALAQRGVPTPVVLAYVVYPPGGLLQRADVATAEVPAGHDLAETLAAAGPGRVAAFEATARLVAQLAHAGARHHDLNARNVLLAASDAFILDVDRVSLNEPPDRALADNLARLTRSLVKIRDGTGTEVSDAEIVMLQARTRERFAELV